MNKSLTIKNYRRENRFFRRRLLVLSGIVVLLAILLISRLAYLQIVQQNMYSTLSQQNQLRLIPIAPTRGLIYDRNGVLLAENLPVFSLTVTPDHVKHLKKVIEQLQQIIPITPTEIQEFYKTLKQHPPYIPVPLKVKLTPQELASFYVNRYRFPGVAVNATLLRYYPFGQTVGNVIGHVGRLSANDLKRIDTTQYSASNYIGKTGIEQFYEDQLHGRVGYQQVEIDASGRAVRTLSQTAPTPGSTLYLTLDNQLQAEAIAALGDEQGAVVALDPNNGQILALVSTPTFDPNAFVMGLSKQEFQTLEKNPGQPLFNRAIRGQYAMGSTIKPFLGLAALDDDYITPTTTIVDSGVFQLPHSKHIYHDDGTAHGIVNVVKAITVSCDIFYFQLAMKLGISEINRMLQHFGFGQSTNIDLQGELTGLVPSPEWKMRVKGAPWYPGDTVVVGIGQGYILVTPLQLAVAVATIAEHGRRYLPYLVEKIQQPDGSIITKQPQEKSSVVLAHPEMWDVIIKGMAGVTSSFDPPGTAVNYFRGVPYTVAGKTGTSQVYQQQVYHHDVSQLYLPKNMRDNRLFVAFAPIDHPQIAIAVVTEHTTIAPLVARKILDYYLLTEKHLPVASTNNSATSNQNNAK